jgi:hypothetical protein
MSEAPYSACAFSPRAQIRHEEVENLRRIYDNLEISIARVRRALRTEGEPLQGERLRRFLEADSDMWVILDRINNIVSE